MQAESNQRVGLQECLSLGYIYLLLLGIASDTLFYNFLGINILNYSNILDVLLSPVKLVVGNLIVLLALLVIISMLYLSMRFLPRLQKPANDGTKGFIWNTFVLGSAFMILCFLLGVGLGKGTKLKRELAKRTTQPDHIITFNDRHKEEVKVVGQNSGYIFFVSKNGNQVVVAPIAGYVSQIENIASN
jgi:hypothetical protein